MHSQRNDYGRFHKKVDPSHKEVRLLIPSPYAGAVIGKSGSTVKRLHNDYNAVVSIPETQTTERILYVAVDESNLEALFMDILKLVESDRLKLFRDNWSFVMLDCPEIRLLVHESQAGCVIGKGGNKIRDLRIQFDLKHLKVFGGKCPMSTDRVIQIGGDDMDRIVAALLHIIRELETMPAKGQICEYDPSNCDGITVLEYGGYARPGSGDDYDSFGGVGRGPGFYDDFGYPGDLVGSGFDDYTGPLIEDKVSLPNKFIGSVMGSAGSRLKQIRQESGTEILVDKAGMGEDGDTERTITIVGTPNQVKFAEHLLQMCVKKYSGFF